MLQILNFDVNQYGNSVVTLTDSGVLNIWNPLEAYDEESDKRSYLLNTCPIDELDLEEDKSKSCDFMEGFKAVLIPNLSSAANARVISIVQNPCRLKHLSRMCIRRRISDPNQLESLRLPRQLISYLSYTVWI